MTPAARYALTAAAAVAGMYLLDPEQGRRRRALVRDKVVSGAARARDAAGVVRRDAGQRLRGAAARSRSLIRARDVSDPVLVERVRAALGRATTHPGAIDVSCSQGVVTLSGAVLRQEHARVMRAARSAAGRNNVRDEIAVYTKPDGVSSLQGESPQRGSRIPSLRENWSPTARVAAGAAGASLAMWGLRQQPAVAVLAATIGGALLIRSASNEPFERIARGAGRRAGELRQRMHAGAEEEAFDTGRDDAYAGAFAGERALSPHSQGAQSQPTPW